MQSLSRDQLYCSRVVPACRSHALAQYGGIRTSQMNQMRARTNLVFGKKADCYFFTICIFSITCPQQIFNMSDTFDLDRAEVVETGDKRHAPPAAISGVPGLTRHCLSTDQGGHIDARRGACARGDRTIGKTGLSSIGRVQDRTIRSVECAD